MSGLRKPENQRTEEPPSTPRATPVEHSSGSDTGTKPVIRTSRTPASYGVVFVNSPGFDLYRDSESTKAFPVGTVIVRETRLEPDDETPRTVLAIIKRAKGFNPKGGDWEFIEADGLDLKIVKRQTTGSCLNCHEQAGKTDFVFRAAATEPYR